MGDCIITRRGGGADISGLDATAANVLSGKKFVGASGEQETGTMTNVASTEAAKSAAASGDNIYFRMTNGAHVTNTSSGYPEVYYAKSNFGNAAANHVLSGKTFTSSAGLKVQGAVPSKAAAVYTPSSTSQKIAAGQYLSGDQTISAVATETKTVSPKSTAQTVTPSSGKFLSSVTVNAAKLLDSSGSVSDNHASADGASDNFTLQTDLNCKINVVLAVASASNSLKPADIKLRAKIGSSTVTLDNSNGTYVGYGIGPSTTFVYLWINDKTYANSTFTNVTFDVSGNRYMSAGNLRVWKS